MSLATILFGVAIAGAVISFIIYWRRTVTPPAHEELKQAIKESAAGVKTVAPVTPDQIANLLKALASLTDSLVKAGPALWSLIGSILFLLIAAIAAGLIGGGKPDAEPSAQSKTEANATTDVQVPASQTNTQANAASNENLKVR